MSERTTMAVVSDLVKTGLTVEQQLLVTELAMLITASRAVRDYERERKQMSRNVPECPGQKERSPTPPKEKLLPPEIAKTQSLPPRGWSEFWETYPRKIGKGSALKSFRNALKRATSEEIVAGAERFRAASTQTEQQFIPHAATWLNADRWADEVKSNVTQIWGPQRTWAEQKAEKAHG